MQKLEVKIGRMGDLVVFFHAAVTLYLPLKKLRRIEQCLPNEAVLRVKAAAYTRTNFRQTLFRIRKFLDVLLVLSLTSH